MLKELLKLLKKGSLIEQSFKQSLEMITILETMFDSAIRYLYDEHNNVQEIYDYDKRINFLEQKIRRNIYNHLVVTQGEDLYTSLVLTHLIIDLERVGDYIKNITELRTLRNSRPDFHEYSEELHQLEAKVRELFRDMYTCLQKQDEMNAIQLQKNYFPVIRLCDQRDEEFLVKELKYPSSDVASLTLYYRYMKRIFAHLINVASAIANPYDRIGFHPQDII